MIDVYGIKLENKNFWEDLKDLSAEKMIEKYKIKIYRGFANVEQLIVLRNGDQGADGPVQSGDPNNQTKLAEILQILKSRS